MGKLAERLGDPARAGVYRVETTDAVEEAAALNHYELLRFQVDRADGIQALERFAAGGAPGGRVALVSGHEKYLAGERGKLLASLEPAAAAWRMRGARIFVVFVDPLRALPALPPLYHWEKSRSAVSG